MFVVTARHVATDLLPCVVRKSGRRLASVRRKSTSPSFLKRVREGHPRAVAPLVVASLLVGFGAGRASLPNESDENLVLPNGYPRTCCDGHELTPEQVELTNKLKSIVGKDAVMDGRVETTQTSQYLKGARLGRGTALCIVTPTHLTQLTQILQAAIDADCVVLVQGQNTGLTGGSVPRSNQTTNESRPTVLISMKNLDTIFPIDGGDRVVCLAGAGLASLQKYVQTNIPGRESHSILGSTFLNPTTAAGIALGSGGTQCRKGPAFTERALYLKVVEDKKTGRKQVKIVNTLGIHGLDEQEGEMKTDLTNEDNVIASLASHVKEVQSGQSTKNMESNNTYGRDPASDVEYKHRLCQHNHEVSRCNADVRGRECNRSEGKVLILATVHDTFPSPATAKTFWISLDSLDSALQFRREVCLDNPKDLPISMEYMDRDTFDVVDRSGRILGHTIKMAGTSSTLVRNLWNVKLWIEALPIRGSATLPDKLLYYTNNVFPSILPKDIMERGTTMDHHIAMTVGDFEGSLDRFMERMDSFQKKKGERNFVIRECTEKSELSALTAFRFVAAPAFRTWCVGQGVQGFSVDYALPKNGGSPPPISDKSATPLKRMRYSHFACNVVHEDVAFAAGEDIESIKHQLKHSVEHNCQGKLPAEHGHGTEYHAPKETKDRWMKMDPLNVLNPGVGGLAMTPRYKRSNSGEQTPKGPGLLGSLFR